ncbi:MAG: hypothetical protein JOY69_08570 [Candidatus Eremiobacteraeota bacterium]|nr:hypothetical protein [Candidatus Eremiobacteraeota bacterium]
MIRRLRAAIPQLYGEYSRAMAVSSVRLWFALGVAIAAASIADPIVEACSNAGWFGAGTFTDHSNLDIAPALSLGALLLLRHLVLRVRVLLSPRGAAPPSLLRSASGAVVSGTAQLLPLTFALQLFVLFAMETIEQIVVRGQPLGGTIWLGGPIAISLAVHAIVCVAALFAIAHCVRALAVRTARAIRALYAFATSRAQTAPGTLSRRSIDATFSLPLPVLCRIGERAPPFQTA